MQGRPTESVSEMFGSNGRPKNRIFLSVAESPPDLSDPKTSVKVFEALTWHFLAFDPLTKSWLQLPGNAGAYFWVAPDALRIAFFRNRALWLRGGKDPDRCLLQLPEPRPLIYQGAWSPDDRQFAVSFTPMGATNLKRETETWLLEIDGPGKTRLCLPPTDGVRDWSCDGGWLLTSCEGSDGEKRQSYVVRLDGTERRRLATSAVCTQARFSPDGRRVASTRGPRRDSLAPPDPREQGSVWLMDLDGANDRMVFGNAELCCQDVRWSPEGDRLAISGFERYPGQSPGKGKLDLSKPFVALIDTKSGKLEHLHPPEPFHLVRGFGRLTGGNRLAPGSWLLLNPFAHGRSKFICKCRTIPARVAETQTIVRPPRRLRQGSSECAISPEVSVAPSSPSASIRRIKSS